MEALKIDWLDVLVTAVVSTSLFVSLILIAKGSSRPLNNRLIGTGLLIINIFVIMTTLITKGLIIDFPWLLRIFSPAYFLIGPILYFYIRQAVMGQPINLRNDYFHFLPAILHLIDLTPFYLLSMEEKRQIAFTLIEYPKLALSTAGGFLPINMWYLLRSVLVITYSTTALVMVFRKRHQTIARANGRSMNLLITTICVIFLIVNILFGFNILILSELIPSPIEVSNQRAVFSPLLELVVIIGLLDINFMFFFLPENTFGLPLPKPIETTNKAKTETKEFNPAPNTEIQALEVNQVTPEPEPKVIQIASQLTQREEKILQQLLYGMETEQWYRQKNFNVEACSQRLGCEKHVLGKIFRSSIKKRFTDFVNDYRIQFILDEIKAGKLANFTLEGLSEQAGFNSRVTFYNAFLKQKGMSPSKFVAEILKTNI